MFAKGKGFFIAIVSILLVTVVGTGVTMYFLSGYLDDYEKNTPTAAASRFIDMVLSGEYEKLYAVSGFEETKYAGKTEYIEYIKQSYTPDMKNAQLNKVITKDEDIQLFNIMDVGSADGSVIGTIEVFKSPNGSEFEWSARAPLPQKSKISITAPYNVEVLINGKPLSPDEGTASMVSAFDGFKDKSLVPQTVLYELDGFIFPPTVTAIAKVSGEEVQCEILTDKETSKHVVSIPVSTEFKSECEKISRTVATAYSSFITKDATRGDVQALVYKNTDFYSLLNAFDNYWYIPHDSARIESFKVNEISAFSQNSFISDVTFDYIVELKKMKKKEYVYPTHYELAFMKLDGKWLLVDLIMK